MCLVIVLGALILFVIVMFVKSAWILLPWTITATAVAGLSGLGLARLAGRSRSAGATISIVSTIALTYGFGYFGYWLLPPKAPPEKQGFDQLLQLPDPGQDVLWQMLPYHLTICAAIGAMVVSRLWYKWTPDFEWEKSNPETTGDE